MTREENNKDDAKKKKLNGEGSPITVGGGGGIGDLEVTEDRLSCIFDEQVYEDPDPGNDKKKFFKQSGVQIQTFKIYADGAVQDLSSDLPADGICEIEVHATGTRDDVTFISRDNGTGTMEFGIDMDTRRYKKNGNVHQADEPSHINKIELNGKKWTFSGSANCAVCVDYVTPDKSTCFA